MGTLVLVVLAVGFAGYAAWRVTRALIGHGRAGDRDSGIDRASAAVSAIGYGALSVTAISLLAGSSSSSGNTSQTTGGVLDWPAGQFIVALAGAIVIGAGIAQIHKGVSGEFMESSQTERMDDHAKHSIELLGTIGHVARGVVFGLVGYFLVKAALDYDPKAAVSLDGALSKLANASYGPLLLGVVAAGLFAFGVYSAADARYRRI